MYQVHQNLTTGGPDITHTNDFILTTSFDNPIEQRLVMVAPIFHCLYQEKGEDQGEGMSFTKQVFMVYSVFS